jgi:hypothetical protein
MLIVFRSSIINSQFTIIPSLCPSTTKASTQNLQTHPPLPRAFLVRHSSLNYREFKTDNWRVISCHFHSSHLKPIQTTSVICTRTLSNLFAKKNSDSFLQAWITRVACSVAFCLSFILSSIAVSTLGVQSKAQQVFPPRKSHRDRIRPKEAIHRHIFFLARASHQHIFSLTNKHTWSYEEAK